MWRKFASCFAILNGIVAYEPIFKLFLRRMMKQLLDDGVRWLDLRQAFTFFYYREGSEDPEPTYDRMFKIFGEEIEKFKASEEGKGFWGMRMIWAGQSHINRIILRWATDKIEQAFASSTPAR